MIESHTIAVNPFFLPKEEQFNLSALLFIDHSKVSKLKFRIHKNHEPIKITIHKNKTASISNESLKIIPTLDNIAKVVCEHYRVSINQLMGKSKKGDTMKARRMYFVIARTKTKKSLREIGWEVNREHCTVVSACNSFEGYAYKKDDLTWEVFQTLKRKFSNENSTQMPGM